MYPINIGGLLCTVDMVVNISPWIHLCDNLKHRASLYVDRLFLYGLSKAIQTKLNLWRPSISIQSIKGHTN